MCGSCPKCRPASCHPAMSFSFESAAQCFRTYYEIGRPKPLTHSRKAATAADSFEPKRVRSMLMMAVLMMMMMMMNEYVCCL